MSPQKLLVIVVVYNGMPWLERCLGSVSGTRSELLSAVDLFVVDNGSTDGSADFVAARFPEAMLVRSGQNLGFGRANNLGLQHAIENGYDAVYLLNQDAWVLPGTLEEMARLAAAAPVFGILSPLQCQADGTTLDRRFEKWFRKAGGLSASEPLRSLPFIMAAHWFITRPCLEKVGLFAPIFPLYGEDVNYCDRARYHGFKIGVALSARAVHDRAARPVDKAQEIRLNCFAGNLARLCDINRPLWERLAYVTLFTGVKTLKYRSFKPWHYWLELVRMLPGIRRTRKGTC